MNHTDALSHLEEYFDGSLSPGVRREIELHLAECARCRDELSSLGALLDTVAEMRSTVVPPPHDLWPGIAAQITSGTEGSGRRGRGLGRREAWTLAPEGQGLLRGALAGGRARWPWLTAVAGLAAVLLVLAGVIGRGGLLRVVGNLVPGRGNGAAIRQETTLAGANDAMARELSMLGTQVESAKGSVRPAGTGGPEAQGGQGAQGGPSDSTATTPSWRLFDEGLAVLDQAIQESRAALERDPNNPVLQKSLLAAYQKQLELLRWANRVVRQG